MLAVAFEESEGNTRRQFCGFRIETSIGSSIANLLEYHVKPNPFSSNSQQGLTWTECSYRNRDDLSLNSMSGHSTV